MKRTKTTRSLVTYYLSPEEHGEAIRRFVESHRTDCGSLGFVPSSKGLGVESVTCSLSEKGPYPLLGAAQVIIRYESSEPEESGQSIKLELGKCPGCGSAYALVGHSIEFGSDEPGSIECHKCKHRAPWSR